MIDGNETSEADRVHPMQAELRSLYELLPSVTAVGDRMRGDLDMSTLDEGQMVKHMESMAEQQRQGEFSRTQRAKLGKALSEARITNSGKKLVEDQFTMDMDYGIDRESEEDDPTGIFSAIGVTKVNFHPEGMYSADPTVLKGIDTRLYEALAGMLDEAAEQAEMGNIDYISDSPIEKEIEDELAEYQEEFKAKYGEELEDVH